MIALLIRYPNYVKILYVVNIIKGEFVMKRNLFAISLITLSCLYGLLAAVLILVFFLLEWPITIGIGISIAFIFLQFLIAPAVNDFVFKHFYKVKWNAELPDYLTRFIEESCEKHKMKYPKMGFIDDGSPNAFTYGRTKNSARVVITRGILDLLTEEEVKTVVAHELGHANHYDMLFMTVAQIVPLVLYYVYEILLDTRSGRSNSSSNNSKGDYGAMIGLVAYILYIVSQYIILWLSRTREYYADSFSMEETKNPSALASALVKIGFGLAVGDKKEESRVSRSSNALGINDSKVSKGMAISAYNQGEVSKESIVKAMRWERWNTWAKLLELSSTHPLISKRLLAISDRCEEFGQERYIEFNEQKPESYFDDFIVELLLSSLPVLFTIIFVVAFFMMMETYSMYAAPIVTPNILIGSYILLLAGSLIVLLNRTHKNKDYKETTVEELLGEVKVSNVTSVPAILEGRIIGRGNPGCIFNEDFVIQDNTGIMFLDYNQPLYIINKVFALFKSQEYFDKTIKVKGWYRRGLVPYMEIYSMEIDGQVKKCHTYKALKIFYGLLIALGIGLILMSFI